MKHLRLGLVACLLALPCTGLAMTNPASTNCVKQGYQLKLINSQGFCFFKDNSYCEEWSYFRGSCKPGQNFLKVDSKPIANKK